MNPNDPWEIPPIPDEGDPEITTTYAAVGQALSRWEVFEGNLGLLYVQFISPGHESDAARASYGSIIAFTARLSMLSAAASYYFRSYPNEALADSYKTLSNTAQKAGAMRNRIAHGVVQPHRRSEPPKPMGWSLIPSYYSVKGRDAEFRPEYALTSQIIDRFGQQFEALCDPAFRLMAEILGTHAKRTG